MNYQSNKASIVQQVYNLMQQGYSVSKQIAEILGLETKKVSRAMRDLKRSAVPPAGRGKYVRQTRVTSEPIPVPSDLLSWFKAKVPTLPELGAVLTYYPWAYSQDRLRGALPPQNPEKLIKDFHWASLCELPEIAQLMVDKPSYRDRSEIRSLEFVAGFPTVSAWFSGLVSAYDGQVFAGSGGVPEMSHQEEIAALQRSLNGQVLDFAPYLERVESYCEENFAGSLKTFRSRERLYSLAQFFHCPSQTYKAVSRSLRIYAVGGGIQTMKSEDRELIFAGCTRIDLKHFQAAVQANLLGLKECATYIRYGFWDRLERETGAEKHRLKTAFYSLVYGSQLYQAQNKAVVEGGMTLAQWEAFESCSLISEMVPKSHLHLRSICNSESVLDAYGQNLVDQLGERPKGKASGSLTMKSARSIAACQAQSYELKVLAPVVTKLIESGVPVLSWLHDGFIIPPDHDPVVLQQALDLGRAVLTEHGIESAFVIETMGEVG